MYVRSGIPEIRRICFRERSDLKIQRKYSSKYSRGVY
jgi:hypothetical protein